MPRNEAGARQARSIYRATLYVDDDDAGVMRRWWDGSENARVLGRGGVQAS
jgi:hypothetical protein